MTINHRPFRQPLGPSREDVILANDFEHVGAHVAGKPRQSAESRNQHGQDQVVNDVPAFAGPAEIVVTEGFEPDNGKESEPYAELIHEQERQPEGRRGETDEDEDGGRPVEERIAPGRRKDADGDGHRQNRRDGEHINENRHRQPFEDLVEHRPIVLGEGFAEIEACQSTEPAAVLNGQRLIETVPGPQFLLQLGACLGIELGLQIGGLAGRQVNDDKGDQGDPQKQRDHQQQTLQQVPKHGSPRQSLLKQA